MDPSEFDRYADAYLKDHRANIAISGEAPEYFHAYKVSEAERFCDEAGLAPQTVLDFGSGIGNSLPFLRQAFGEARICCADVSTRSLEIAEGRFPGAHAEFLRIAGDALPLADGTVDLAFTACVFHHIAPGEHGRWLSELRRVTRAGGLLVLFEHNPLNPLTRHAVNTCPFDANARLQRAGTLAGRVRDAGWRAPQIRYHVFFPRLLAALRPLEKRLGWLPLGAQFSIVATA
ncbi:class I SAM-dependent methyltransferase [Zavarzinia sp.]|uniref:class I SAM-dependent methyltransferase n=1 Tax=Zavarzinia sp. TaxID=2027920 RepID=UPI003564BF93